MRFDRISPRRAGNPSPARKEGIFCRLAASQSSKNCRGRRLKCSARPVLGGDSTLSATSRKRMNRPRRAKLRRSDSGATGADTGTRASSAIPYGIAGLARWAYGPPGERAARTGRRFGLSGSGSESARPETSTAQLQASAGRAPARATLRVAGFENHTGSSSGSKFPNQSSLPFIPRGNATENRWRDSSRHWGRVSSRRSPSTCHDSGPPNCKTWTTSCTRGCRCPLLCLPSPYDRSRGSPGRGFFRAPWEILFKHDCVFERFPP